MVKPLKNKKARTFLNAFIERLNESHCKPNELWFGQGKEFHNKLMQK